MKAEVYSPELVISGIEVGFRKNTKNWIAPKFKVSAVLEANPSIWYFDVRASVENLGLLLREVQIIKNLLSPSRSFSDVYAVVAPHTSESTSILSDQNIKVINYEPQSSFDCDIDKNIPERRSLFYEIDDDYEILGYPTIVY